MDPQKRGGKKRGFGGFFGVITHIYPPDGVPVQLTRAYPKDRVEGPAYHSRDSHPAVFSNEKPRERSKLNGYLKFLPSELRHASLFPTNIRTLIAAFAAMHQRQMLSTAGRSHSSLLAVVSKVFFTEKQ